MRKKDNGSLVEVVTLLKNELQYHNQDLSFFLVHQLVVTLQQYITIQNMRSKIHNPKYEIGAVENHFHRESILAEASIIGQKHRKEGLLAE